MRVAILTLPLSNHNYGGAMQCYALFTIIKRLGHEVIVLDRRSYDIDVPIWQICLQIIKKYLFRTFVYNMKCLRRILNVSEYDVFINKNIPYTLPICDSIRLKQEIVKRNIQSVVVGSDQVWRASNFQSMKDYFLPYDIDVRKISYAASFGTDRWIFDNADTHFLGKLLNRFHSVSVRENIGLNFCRKYFGIKAKLVMDPTLLLREEDYLSIIKHHSKQEKIHGLLGLYILDKDKETDQIIEDCVHHKGFSEYPFVDCPSSTFSDWLQVFYQSDFIVTDSFHGCVFSIIFNKPFIAIANRKRGVSRFISLLELLNLKVRLVFSYNDFLNKRQLLFDNINYSSVNNILKIQREESLNFLKGALE
jgi:hypothetical protein